MFLSPLVQSTNISELRPLIKNYDKDDLVAILTETSERMPDI